MQPLLGPWPDCTAEPLKQRRVNSELSQHKPGLISHPGLWFARFTYFCRRWVELPLTSSRVQGHSQFHVISGQAKTRINSCPSSSCDGNNFTHCPKDYMVSPGTPGRW